MGAQSDDSANDKQGKLRMTKKTLPPESTFVHELRDSLERYAGSPAKAPTMKMQGSVVMSSVPDIFGYYKGRHFWMECKRRELPQRKFDLMTGLSPGQRTVLRSWTIAGGNVFLAVRLGYDVALVMDFKKLLTVSSFPTSMPVDFHGDGYVSIDGFTHGIHAIHRKSRGLWENIGNVIGGGENE